MGRTEQNMALACRGLSRILQKNLVVRTVSTTAVKFKVNEGENVDFVTHTGQVWDKDDYRRSRFVGKDKLVNPRFAIDLIAQDPVVVCNVRRVSSSSGGALGHPKVYINLDRPEIATCGYSGQKFIHQKYYDAAKHGPSITYAEYLQEMERIKS